MQPSVACGSTAHVVVPATDDDRTPKLKFGAQGSTGIAVLPSTEHAATSMAGTSWNKRMSIRRSPMPGRLRQRHIVRISRGRLCFGVSPPP